MRYPRSVLTALPRGQHLGSPDDPSGRARILDAALALLVSAREPALVELAAPAP
ncbi:MAG: hypothetical protein NVS4B10_05160 [Myxococcales bacterium]